MKYGEPSRSLTTELSKRWVNVVMIAEKPAKASPAMSAPPGLRIPNVTAIANQNRPTSGGAVLAETWVEKIPRHTPPRPATAAAKAKIRTRMRSTRIPADLAATSELRTASIARPDAERWRPWIDRVTIPKITRNSRICTGSLLESIRCCLPTTSRSTSWLSTGRSTVGWRITHPELL